MSLNISFIIQILIILGLTIGYIYVKRKRITSHSYIMLTIYVTHVLSILIFMWKPAINILENMPMTRLGYTTAIHSALGIIVLALSTYVILQWRFKKPAARCYKMKKTMRILTLLWIAEALIGTFEYFILYIE